MNLHIPQHISVFTPLFMPWPLLISRISLSSHVIMTSNLQYRKNYFQNRTKLIGPTGEYWLTAPVAHPPHGTPIDETYLSGEARFASRKLSNSIVQHYGNTPYFDEFGENILRFINKYIVPNKYALSVINVESIKLFFMCTKFPMPNITHVSSGESTRLDRTGSLLHYANSAGASGILNGFGGSANAHDSELLKSNGIYMLYIDPEIYRDILPGVSYVHYLFYYGPDFFHKLNERMFDDYSR